MKWGIDRFIPVYSLFLALERRKSSVNRDLASLSIFSHPSLSTIKRLSVNKFTLFQEGDSDHAEKVLEITLIS